MMIELIKRLSEAYGPAGAEDQIREILQQALATVDCEIHTDALGNLIVQKPGTDPSAKPVVITVNMDEAGLMVIDVDEQGFLRVGPVGSSNPHKWIGQRVMFSDGAIGVVAGDSLKDEKERTFAHLHIDIGISGNRAANGEIPQPIPSPSIGDVAVLHLPWMSLQNQVWIGKALDNRAGCAAVLHVLQTLPTLAFPVCAVFSAQHRVGTRGIKPALYSLDPRVGMGVGCVSANDAPGVKCATVALGQGPAIVVMERNLIVNKELRMHMATLADAQSIPYQWAIAHERVSDAGTMAATRTGVPAGGISIPVRHHETGSEMMHQADFAHAVQLLKAWLLSL
ncbi:hypothetical protein LSG31_17820 [Fodinisporobacter ferrooxydans]|uniref:Peptidase M42 n=1 Tax=Fodinisporobacter ferrooxydans TaxID=2901836 RepID=A0ABY4CKM5_9BACL|nr:hypothetical protein LSG31_17820 [Alicyclobacillaceae bacterium MYW30-H2]